MAIANGTCVSFCNQPKAHSGFPWVRLWDNHGKCLMDRKRIQCLSNALQHIPIYLQPFTSYIARYWSEIATFSYPLPFNVPAGGVPIGIPGKKFGPQKTRITALPGCEDSLTIGWAVSIQYQRVTDRRTDRRPTYIITCAVWLTHVNDACFCWCWHTIPHFAASFHPESNTLTRFKQTNLVTRQTVSCSNCNRYRMYDVRAPLIVHAIRLTTVSDPPDSNPDVTYLYLHPAGAHVRCKLDAA